VTATDAELASHEAAERADRDAMGALLDSEHKLANADAEIKRLNAMNAGMQRRINGLLNEKNAAIEETKKARRRADKLERELGRGSMSAVLIPRLFTYDGPNNASTSSPSPRTFSAPLSFYRLSCTRSAVACARACADTCPVLIAPAVGHTWGRHRENRDQASRAIGGGATLLSPEGRLYFMTRGLRGG